MIPEWYEFTEDNFKRSDQGFRQLAGKLYDRESSVARDIYDGLDSETRSLLASFVSTDDGRRPLPRALERALHAELNRLIRGPRLIDRSGFGEIACSPNTSAMVDVPAVKTLFGLSMDGQDAQKTVAKLDGGRITSWLRRQFRKQAEKVLGIEPQVVVEVEGSEWSIDDGSKRYFVKADGAMLMVSYLDRSVNICLNRSLLADAFPDEITLCGISQTDFNILVECIHDRRSVPFLGAGVNAACEVRQIEGLPLGSNLADQLNNGLDLRVRDADRKGLARIALQGELRAQRRGLIDKIHEILSYEQCPPSPLLDVIAKLPFDLIVTTNYDWQIEKALSLCGREHITIAQPRSGNPCRVDEQGVVREYNGFKECNDELEKWVALPTDQPERTFPSGPVVVYKIHGSLVQEARQSESIVVTEDDYIAFLTVIPRINESKVVDLRIPRRIAARLKSKDGTVLFLGYSLEDWSFRSIFKSLFPRMPTIDTGSDETATQAKDFGKNVARSGETDQQAKKTKWYSIQRDATEFWHDYWESQGVKIYKADVYDFGERLKQEYFERYPAEKHQR